MEVTRGAVAYSVNEVGVVQWWSEVPDWIPSDCIVVLDEYERRCR